MSNAVGYFTNLVHYIVGHVYQITIRYIFVIITRYILINRILLTALSQLLYVDCSCGAKLKSLYI